LNRVGRNAENVVSVSSHVNSPTISHRRPNDAPHAKPFAQNKKALAANAEVLLGLHQRLVGDAGFEPATPAV